MKGLFALIVLVTTAAGCPLGRGSKGYGEKCEHNNDCAEAHCAEIGKFCTKSCAADAECGAGRACMSGACDAAKPASTAP